MRFEITNHAASFIPLDVIKAELRKAGATRVNARRAFGWSNQPRVATFSAIDHDTARRICTAAGSALFNAGQSNFRAPLVPYMYLES